MFPKSLIFSRKKIQFKGWNFSRQIEMFVLIWHKKNQSKMRHYFCPQWFVKNSLCKLILQKYFLKWLKFLCFWGCEMRYLYLIAFAIIHGKRSSPTAKSISFGTKEFAIAGATIHFSIMLSDSSRVKQLFTIGCKRRTKRCSVKVSIHYLYLDRFKDTIKSFCAIFFKNNHGQ